MRLFIAIDLPDGMKKNIGEIIDKFDKTVAKISFIDPKNLHITLKFLGDLREDDVNSVVNILNEYVENKRQFYLDISGFGFFGSPKFIRTLWLGIKDGKNETVQIINELNSKLHHIRREDFTPSPHLTIGRVKEGNNNDDLLYEIKRFMDVKIGTTRVNNIKLYKSILTPSGPVYTELNSFKFGRE